MALEPGKGYRALRRGRYSAEGVEYFLTFCTQSRAPGIDRPALAVALFAEIEKMEDESIWTLQCGVIMPDHIHLLVRLGEKLPLGRAIARLKGKTAAALKPHLLGWQAGYFDRRIRPFEDRLPYFLHIYLNPYRAGLLALGAQWPAFRCGEIEKEWFMPLLSTGIPKPEWLSWLP